MSSNPFLENPAGADDEQGFEQKWTVVQWHLSEDGPGYFFFEAPDIEMPAPWERATRRFGDGNKEVWKSPVLKNVLLDWRTLKMFTVKEGNKKTKYRFSTRTNDNQCYDAFGMMLASKSNARKSSVTQALLYLPEAPEMDTDFLLSLNGATRKFCLINQPDTKWGKDDMAPGALEVLKGVSEKAKVYAMDKYKANVTFNQLATWVCTFVPAMDSTGPAYVRFGSGEASKTTNPFETHVIGKPEDIETAYIAARGNEELLEAVMKIKEANENFSEEWSSQAEIDKYFGQGQPLAQAQAQPQYDPEEEDDFPF